MPRPSAAPKARVSPTSKSINTKILTLHIWSAVGLSLISAQIIAIMMSRIGRNESPNPNWPDVFDSVNPFASETRTFLTSESARTDNFTTQKRHGAAKFGDFRAHVVPTFIDGYVKRAARGVATRHRAGNEIPPMRRQCVDIFGATGPALRGK